MWKILSFTFLLAAFTNSLFSQTNYPKNYFGSPIKKELILTGNFGEIRPNHFHSGFDIKTHPTEGVSVYAVADGYISRIKVSPYGYGNALYITHPNGYTSLYAHLKNFNTAITKYVRTIQYTNQVFEVDTTLPPGLFPIKKGTYIALSGNSGGSQGPHLHFEIRDTKTEMPINPHYFGFSIPDKIAPKVEKIVIYPLNDTTIINGKNEPFTIIPSTPKEIQFVLPKDSIAANGKIGIGIECYDIDDISNNKNAVFSVEVQMERKRIYYYEMEKFSFENTRYVNAHIDFECKQNNKGTIQKCFLAKNNEIGIYKDVINNGEIILNDTLEHWITLIIKDFKGNANQFNFKIKGILLNQTFQPAAPPSSFYFMDCLKKNELKRTDVQLNIPEKALYNDVYLDYKKSSADEYKYAPLHYIHNTTTPLHKNMELAIKSNYIPDSLKNKSGIVQITDKGKKNYYGGKYSDNWIITETKQFGNYTIAIDTTCPQIKTAFKEPESGIVDLNKIKKLQFYITDNLSGISKYRAYLNNEWVLMENDAKNNLFTIILPDEMKNGFYDLLISIFDDKENKTTWECFLKKSD